MSNPHQIVINEQWADLLGETEDAAQQPDRRDGSVYLLTPELRTAIKVALVTYRPLLLRGDPGTGKSSLASYIARNLNWRYYELVVTARTEARDLLYTYDAVRRLADAQAFRTDSNRPGSHAHLDPSLYIEPGVFWWAIDRDSASRRGLDHAPADLRSPVEPNEPLNRARSTNQAVVLIDEIDKADPDVPNSLLVALGSNVFQIPETGREIRAAKPSPSPPDQPKLSPLLVVITTNEERDLPRAFVRRCITHTLLLPDGSAPFIDHMLAIAERHRRRDGVSDSDVELARARAVAARLFEWRTKARESDVRPPGIAEYLDAVRACRELGITPEVTDSVWALVEQVTLRKTS